MNAPNHMNCMDFDIPKMMKPIVTNVPPKPIILRVPNFSMQAPYTVKLTIVFTMLSIVKIVMNCAPDAGSSTYCFDMTGLEGGANASADTGAKTISWTGSASKVVLHANNGQVRIEKVTIEFE